MADSINPRMLTVARESRGYTQTGLAAELGINQSTYSRYESAATTATVGDLRAIGRILDYPDEFFNQADVVWGFASPVFYHRKSSRLSIGDLRIIQAKLNVTRFHVTRLWPGVDIESSVNVPTLELADYGSPSRIAQVVRSAWRLPLGPINDLIGTMESAGIVIKPTDFGTNRIDAVVQIAPDAPPVILTNKFVPGDRLRFTLAHELGHLVMHGHPTLDMEAEANEFASEFLMPAREIKPQLRNAGIEKLPDLKLEWKVSMSSLIKRAQAVGAISERHGRTLFMRMSSNGWRTKEPCPIEQEKPRLIRDVLNTYLIDYHYSVAEVARLVNSTESSFRADYLDDCDFTAPRLLTTG